MPSKLTHVCIRRELKTLSETAKTLEAQGLRDLDEYVVKAIMADPSRKPLRQVKETLCTWTRNRGLPVVPISATTVFLYAHNIFVGQKAVWKHELRMSLLNVLAELRSVANKAYENDFRGMIQYRKAFLDSILDTPEARALATVERDLDTDSDSRCGGRSQRYIHTRLFSIFSSDSAREDKAVSSGEEVAQKLTASSPGDTKRKDSAVDNPTPSSPDSGRPVFKRRRRNSKALPIHPTDPSEWTNARMLNPKMLNSDHSIALKTDISRQPAQRIVIDLSLDTSDEEELPTPAVATAHQAVPVERSSNSRASQQVDIASQSGEDTQATVQRQPRPPLIPRPRTEGVRPSTRPAAVQSPPAPEPSSSTDANNVSFPTVNKANENPSSGAASGPDDPLNTRQSAAVFFNKAVRAVKEKLAGNVLPACSDPPNPGSESSLPAQPQSEAIHDGASKTCTLGSASGKPCPVAGLMPP